ncbi:MULTISPECIES: PAS domain S-box protein [Sphingomonas]|uniref:PAS domain S-box protein n=1 Tax=Sphingomonas TaxID=13687 RepID=UPI000DEF468B|nr:MULTISPECIES: PAS domain S-box protein [Sphingomonas]
MNDKPFPTHVQLGSSDEARLRLALDAGRMAIWSVDQDGSVEVSPEFSRLLRLPQDRQPLLDELLSRYYPGELERVQEFVGAAYARGDRFAEWEYRHLWPDDSVRWLLVRAELLRSATGEPAGSVGVIMDVTDRKQTEEALKEREGQLSAFISQATAGFAQVDTTGLFTLVNDRFCEIAGRSREELYTLRLQDITHPEDLGRNLPLFEKAVRDGTPYSHEKRYVRPDGGIVWVNNSVSVVRRNDGELYGVLAVCIDVTDRRRAEALIHENEARLRAITDNLPGGMVFQISTGASGRERHFAYLSQSFEQLTGYSLELLKNDPLLPYKIILPEDAARLAAAEEAAVRSEAPFDEIVRFRRADGQVRWGRIISAARRQADGTRIWDGIKIDVTEQKNAEARDRLLVEITDKLRLDDRRAALNEVAALLGRHFACGRTGYAYLDASEDLFDYDVCWTDGSIDPIFGQLPASSFGVKIVAALNSGETIVIKDLLTDTLSDEPETRATAGSVDTRAILVVPFMRGKRLRSIVYLNSKEPRAWSPQDVALMQEVAERSGQMAERAEAEEALRSLNASLEAQVAERTADRDRMWRLSTDLMLVARFDATITAINPAWTTLLGWSEEDLLGKPFLSLVHPDDLQATVREAQRLEEGLTTLRFENRYRTRAGDFVWLSWTAVPDANFIHAVARDISAEKATAARLQEAQEALRQSQKLEAMGQLTGGVAHDFNNLLSPIIGGLDLLQRRGIGDERTQRTIGAALASAERAKTLVQRLLAFARRQPLQPTAVDVPRLIKEMAGLLASTLGPRIELALDLAEDLPPALADANQLEMALLNLTVNARDAMDGGGHLHIAAQIHHIGTKTDRLAEGKYVRVTVRDTGRGMDSETLARCIEPFFSTKGIGQGTGLGLSMVHGLAAQLSGDLSIKSAPGAGTSIELLLPVSKTRAAMEEEATEPDLAPLAGSALVIDDEELVRCSTAEMLAELGYDTIQAASAEDALRIFGERNIDLLVTDHLMPGMTGVELARQVSERRPNTKILIVSGYADVQGIDTSYRRLTKPFRQADLAAALADA